MRFDKVSQPQSTDVDQLQAAVKPVSFGHPVQLIMEFVSTSPRDTKRFIEPNRLVLLTPGMLHKMPASTVIVSIVGKGSAVVDLRQPEKVANLVLAGMPGTLARALMNALHRNFGE